MQLTQFRLASSFDPNIILISLCSKQRITLVIFVLGTKLNIWLIKVDYTSIYPVQFYTE